MPESQTSNLKPQTSRAVELVPSILSADFARLGEEVRAATQAGARRFQVDVMDGVFVPNITMGALAVEAVRRSTDAVVEAHLMIVAPEQHVPAMAKAGADLIIIHQEATVHLHRVVQQIKGLGKQAGVALNPATPLVMLEEILPYLDMVLLMTVNPGFGGQEFIESMLPKIERLRRRLDTLGLDLSIEVDGGVHLGTAGRCVAAGATLLVAGSAVFGTPEGIPAAMQALRDSYMPPGA
jgi:ribulose-phosphate 3-epimerase